MPEDERSTSANQEFSAQIAAAYVRKNQIAASDLSALISTMYEALGRLSAPPAEPVAERTPARVNPQVDHAGRGRLPRLRLARPDAPPTSCDRSWAVR